MISETMIYTVITLLGIIVVWEYLRNAAFSEGFTDGVVPEYFARFFPRRYDIVPGQVREEEGWVRNQRYSEEYVDTQGFGYAADFCRVVEKEDHPETRMVACALAGQEGLDPYLYRTESARAGMKFSRDDYFRGADYGRILKMTPAPNDTWEARVVLAGVTRYKQSGEVADNMPPPAIAELLYFYEGIMVWYRMFDDLLDYGENTQISIAGDMKIDETPRKAKTKGLGFNRGEGVVNQFIKIGENPALEFNTKVQLRELRAISVWVYFEEFTQNARIFDFGNGAGKDNVLLGIEGKGNDPGAFGRMNARPPATAAVCNTRRAAEVTPQDYLKTTDANVDEWDCPEAPDVDSAYPADELTPGEDAKANLLFEIWDAQQRKMRLRILNCIPRRKWVHVALTTRDKVAFRPTWDVYVDGVKVYSEEDGHMALNSYTTKNYLGRSNWEGTTSQYQDADERFKGSLFDFRLYRSPMSADKVKKTVAWGKRRLT